MSLWALGGIAFMMIGIVGACIFIKQQVYVCPAGAACPGSFNPDNSFLQDIRTVMQYWLHVGMLIFRIGLVRLVAYQAWSAMQQRRGTIDILGLSIGVVKGSASDAVNLLFLRRWNRSLGMFVLTHAAIIIAISLVVGRSITTVTDTGRVELLFNYPMNISILNVNEVSNRGLGSRKYGATWAWLIDNAMNSTSNKTISGTLIIQDSHAEYRVNAQLSGKQISGSVFCVDPSTNIFVNMTGFAYSDILNITYLPDISTRNLAIGKLTGQYLLSVTDFNQNATFIWFTITNGIIPNAMEIPKSAFNNSAWALNSLFIGLCEHTVTFPNLTQNDTLGNGMQYINPSYTFLPVRIYGNFSHHGRMKLCLPRRVQ